MFNQPETYLRCRSTNGWKTDYYIEYNLDEEDDAWLANFNGGQSRLSPDKLEAMLHYLEVLNADATTSHMLMLGTSEADRRTPAACNALDHLPRATALDMLQRISGLRGPVCDQVYQYWRAKRKARSGVPLLRRLQAPTPLDDQDPYKVFRPREKNRMPQSRRKKENDVRSFEKMKEMRVNLSSALGILDNVARRERRKRDLLHAILDQQVLQMRLKLDGRDKHEAAEAEIVARARIRNLNYKNDALEAAAAGTQTSALAGVEPETPNLRLMLGLANIFPRFATRARLYKLQTKRNLIQDKEARAEARAATARLPSAPVTPELKMEFTLTPNLAAAVQDKGLLLPAGLDLTTCRPRFGRGGRVILDRCDPITKVPYSQQASTAPAPVPAPVPFHRAPAPVAAAAAAAAAPPAPGPSAPVLSVPPPASTTPPPGLPGHLTPPGPNSLPPNLGHPPGLPPPGLNGFPPPALLQGVPKGLPIGAPPPGVQGQRPGAMAGPPGTQPPGLLPPPGLPPNMAGFNPAGFPFPPLNRFPPPGGVPGPGGMVLPPGPGGAGLPLPPGMLAPGAFPGFPPGSFPPPGSLPGNPNAVNGSTPMEH